MVVVVFVGELEDGLAGLVAEPYDGAADKFVVPLGRGDLPGTAYAGKLLGCAQVGDHLYVGVTLKERGGHLGGGLLLDYLADDAGAVFAPCHGDDALGLEDVADAEGDGRGGYLVVFVVG